jgi:hypothetical protein
MRLPSRLASSGERRSVPSARGPHQHIPGDSSLGVRWCLFHWMYHIPSWGVSGRHRRRRRRAYQGAGEGSNGDLVEAESICVAHAREGTSIWGQPWFGSPIVRESSAGARGARRTCKADRCSSTTSLSDQLQPKQPSIAFPAIVQEKVDYWAQCSVIHGFVLKKVNK